MPTIETLIEMNDYAFTSDPNETLLTHGITTCIAFVIQGFYISHETEEKIGFCGLYHASDFLAGRCGVSDYTEDPDSDEESDPDLYEDEDEDEESDPDLYEDEDTHTDEIVTQFLRNLREALSIDEGINVHIKSLQFIGGEKKEVDANNEIVLSGTEAEVESLKRVIGNFNFESMNFIKPAMPVGHEHYLTTGNSSISIALTIDGCTKTVCADMEEEEEEPNSAPKLGM